MVKYLITFVLLSSVTVVSIAQDQQTMEYSLSNGNKIIGVIISNNIVNISIKSLDGSIFVIDKDDVIRTLAINSTKISSAKILTEKILLKNGSIINGEILSSSDGIIKLKTSDGMIWKFSTEDLIKVIKNTVENNNEIKKMKLKNSLSIIGGISLNHNFIPQIELKYIRSYLILSTFSLGIGIKSDLYFQNQNTVHLLIPLFSFSLMPWKDKLFFPTINADLGYSFYSSLTNDVGFSLNPNLSTCVFRNKSLGVGLSLGYNCQYVSLTNNTISSLNLEVDLIF